MYFLFFSYFLLLCCLLSLPLLSPSFLISRLFPPVPYFYHPHSSSPPYLLTPSQCLFFVPNLFPSISLPPSYIPTFLFCFFSFFSTPFSPLAFYYEFSFFPFLSLLFSSLLFFTLLYFSSVFCLLHFFPPFFFSSLFISSLSPSFFDFTFLFLPPLPPFSSLLFSSLLFSSLLSSSFLSYLKMLSYSML